MSTSLFLPQETIDEILSHVKHDKHSLYSCLLVNRYWCRQVIPWLWGHPLKILSALESANIAPLIRTYISCLSEKERSFLIEHGISLPNYPPPFFHYASYLKDLDYRRLEISVRHWIKYEGTICSSYPTRRRAIAGISLNNASIIVMTALCRLFLEGDPTLHQLKLAYTERILDLPDVSIFVQGQKGLSCLQKIKFIVGSFNRTKLKNMIAFLEALPDIAPNVSHLDIDVITTDKTMADTLVSIIEGLSYLSEFRLCDKSSGVTQVIEPTISALSSRANSLTSLELHNIHFQDLSLQGLAECKKLEVLLIIQCCCLTLSTWKPLENAKFPLKTLYLDSDFGEKVTIAILQSASNRSIKQLHLSCATSKVIEILPVACPSLAHLDVCVSNVSIEQLVAMVSGIQQLQYLAIMEYGGHNPKLVEVTPDLGKIFTPLLHYLELNFIMTFEQLDALLTHCKAPLETLILNQYFENHQMADEYFAAIAKFAKERGTLKRLCVNNDGIKTINCNQKSVIIQDLLRYVKILSYSDASVKICEQT
ncbi:16597_t:CDS:1 [Dentiscutata erythropus]|uniref:16597_t:CDS:1 n=1 Tax=Dentiscutata erythropus TaxID=1348616 RepID=A0A9N9C257_9GLOM|nr:16597_t:CDS:1 [Dentiscutata erythropus]